MAAVLISAASFGQFFTSTSYRGAFGVGSGANWMTGWTNFDPANAVYPGNGAGESLAGKTRVDIGTTTDADGYHHITSNTTWSNTNVYYLNNPVAVDAGVTLTIQAGTYVRGLNNAIPTCLVVSRGGKLNAIGTASQPIVMTSAAPNGSRNTGDWGGLVVCGKAKVNLNKSPNLGGRSVEGTVTTAPATASYYGAGNGSSTIDDSDNSGTIRYVRVEFAGDATVANLELNGIMLAGVGSGTAFDHVQVSYSKDDSFEWFGGTVDGKYLVAFGGTDDDLMWMRDSVDVFSLDLSFVTHVSAITVVLLVLPTSLRWTTILLRVETQLPIRHNTAHSQLQAVYSQTLQPSDLCVLVRPLHL